VPVTASAQVSIFFLVLWFATVLWSRDSQALYCKTYIAQMQRYARPPP